MSIDINEEYDKVYRYCYFKTSNQQIAEDLTQETFLKYFQQTSYIDHGKPLAYLYTIAKNLCTDHYRAVKAIPLTEEVCAFEELAGLDTSIAVKQALSTLPEDVRELLLLRFANELSMNEICKMTTLSRFAVYRKINAALKELRLILREDDFI